MYKAVTLAGGICEPLLTCSSLDSFWVRAVANSFEDNSLVLAILECNSSWVQVPQTQKPLARAQLFKTNDDIVNDSLKFQMLISQICQYFLWKKCDKLLHSVQKLLSYFQRKMSVYWL